MMMYGIYNLETLEKLIDTIHELHNSKTLNEDLYAGTLDSWYSWYLTKDGINYYAPYI